MTWLAWRQARAQTLVAVGATVMIAIVLLATRAHIASTPEEDLSTIYSSLQLLGTVLIGVPAAIGAFWGAPLLARELELGTHRLAWTQGVTRGRWLGVKLAVLAAAAIVVTASIRGVVHMVVAAARRPRQPDRDRQLRPARHRPHRLRTVRPRARRARRRDHASHVAGHGRDPRRVLRGPVHVPVGGTAATRRAPSR